MFQFCLVTELHSEPKERSSFMSGPGFLSLSTVDIWGQMNLEGLGARGEGTVLCSVGC